MNKNETKQQRQWPSFGWKAALRSASSRTRPKRNAVASHAPPEDGCVNTCHFPLTAMPIQSFLKLDRLEAFESMRARSVTTQNIDSSAPVVFISHQWTDDKGCDPGGVQLRRIQDVFRIIIEQGADAILSPTEISMLVKAGSHLPIGYQSSGFTSKHAAFSAGIDLLAELRRAYVWMDYFSVPQSTADQPQAATIAKRKKCPNDGWSGLKASDKYKAVKSIPYYIERSSLFFVVAPQTMHTKGYVCDLESWRSRGWCRLEEWANNLSVNSKCPIVVTENNVLVQSWEDHIVNIGGTHAGSVACGQFTVEGDRALCQMILKEMWQYKLSRALENGALLVAKYLAIYSFHMFLTHEGADPGGPLLDHSSRGAMMSSLRLLNDKLNGDVSTKSPHSGIVCLAAMAGNVQLMKDVLDEGEDPTARDMAGRTPLERCAATGNIDTMKHLLASQRSSDLAVFVNGAGTKHANVTPLMRAAKSDFVDVLQLLIASGADLNAKRLDTGRTALHEAAMNGSSASVEVLVQAGADVHALDNAKNSALHCAATGRSLFCKQKGKTQAARLLIESGVDVQVQNAAHQTAADVANKEGNRSFIENFVDNGG